jgi:serine protease Do
MVAIEVPAAALPEAGEILEQSVVSVGEAESAWLGVLIAEVTQEKAQELKLPALRGVLVTEVEADSPAAKAGLKANDVITEFNEQRVEGTLQFRRLVRETPVGHTVQLTFWRNGQAKTISVELTSLRAQIEKQMHMVRPRGAETDIHLGWRSPLLGISGEDVSGQLGAYFGVPGAEGVLIREVKPGSPADKAGLKAGDVIIKASEEQVRSVSALQNKLRDQKTFSLTVIRKGAQISANVEIE